MAVKILIGLTVLTNVARTQTISSEYKGHVGRLIAKWKSETVVGDELCYWNWMEQPKYENKACFALPETVIDTFFDAYYGPSGVDGKDCASAYKSIGFSQDTIDDYATGYSNGVQFFTYVLAKEDSVMWASGKWEDVLNMTATLYKDWPADLTDTLFSHLDAFKGWSHQVKTSENATSVFKPLIAEDFQPPREYFDMTNFRDTATYVDTEGFLKLASPSAKATRAWLNNKMGLFPEYLGTGFTLLIDRPAEQGLPEIVIENRKISDTDLLIPLNCMGGGFQGTPGKMVVYIDACDDFDLYVDGELFYSNEADDNDPQCDHEILEIPPTSKLVGIHAKQISGVSKNGIMATIGINNSVTDASWSCQSGFNKSWVPSSFNFSRWPKAQASPPTKPRPEKLVRHSDKAEWIWTANKEDKEVYCVTNFASSAVPKSPTPEPKKSVSTAVLVVVILCSFLFCSILTVIVWKKCCVGGQEETTTQAPDERPLKEVNAVV